jgi:hypothetical protein
VLNASDVVPAQMLKGPRYQVDARVPTDGFLAHFTIQSDFGTFEVRGREMLPIRLTELAALEQLEAMSHTEEFATAVAAAAARPLVATKEIIEHPVATISGIPAGVGHFFERTYRQAKRGVEDASGAGGAPTPATAGAAAGELLGYNKARRQLAKSLQVDPYTTNTVLSKKLDEAAWASFAGGFTVRVGIALVPASFAVSLPGTIHDTVWEMHPGDLQALNEKKLQAMGVADQPLRAFVQNRWFTPTLQTALVTALDSLTGVAGRAEVITIASNTVSEEQARFIVGSTHMLARHHATGARLTQVQGRGTVVGRTQGGGVVIPAVVDYVVWTKKLQSFAQRADLRVKERSVVLSGRMSPHAKREFLAQGWKVQEEVSF